MRILGVLNLFGVIRLVRIIKIEIVLGELDILGLSSPNYCSGFSREIKKEQKQKIGN